jgi:hypothetical protein
MNEQQITIEEMQGIIGRLAMNYEIQINRMTSEIRRLQEEAAKIIAPVE